ncbi:SWI/SNF-related chromatin binding protein [Schistosoma mansoni]|uniref:SWI/SNF-related chromatin binding protein n=1 Tax=Schistosoma mansoni TaxID=6183 RepID=UPI0001A640FE|nr:SWI/SNF-related chromatin binding protein [Schistosoma mansoni]|eukprot:XP_018647155.1 SWI/SNF-related chromatin binding protein [Schistosoma mansoni]
MTEDKGRPKSAMNAYAAFLQSMRANHKKKHPNVTLDFKSFSKECSEQWKNQSAKEKKFKDLAEKDKERYRCEMEHYEPPTDEGCSKKRKRDPDALKRHCQHFSSFAMMNDLSMETI